MMVEIFFFFEFFVRIILRGIFGFIRVVLMYFVFRLMFRIVEMVKIWEEKRKMVDNNIDNGDNVGCVMVGECVCVCVVEIIIELVLLCWCWCWWCWC